MSRSNPSHQTQIRLIIDRSWVAQLDTLAASRFQNHLALIRFYLRQAMDKDLEDLEEFLKKRGHLEAVRQQTQRYIDDHQT